MPCTTILVGKSASYDGSTMIARTDDGGFDVKKIVATTPEKQPKVYKSVIGHLEIPLPENPLRYTSAPNVDLSDGLWPATGINEANVGMTATETITTNPRVLGADPMVRYKKAASKKEKDIPGGIGEEDLVLLVLPYIRTAREGVLRLGSLLEQYGTYESNGIAFNDKDEIWWLETIGGHHWIARRVQDDECVIMPNQFGLDRFDFDDAFGERKDNMCSADLKEFIADNHLDLGMGGAFDPRAAFGSHSDGDHLYNTPRAWFMGRCLAPTRWRWDGENADFTPMSDNIPWAIVPEHKVTVEDVKYILSSYYQGTPYNPYAKRDNPERGKYRTIGKCNTGVMTISQIRGYMPEAIQAIEWVCFGSTSFDAMIPIYANTSKIPAYLSRVETDVDTDNFYWCSRLLNTLADGDYAHCLILIERYQQAMFSQAHRLLNEYDRRFTENPDLALIDKANNALCEEGQKETQRTLNLVLAEASRHMKNNYFRGDN